MPDTNNVGILYVGRYVTRNIPKVIRFLDPYALRTVLHTCSKYRN